MIKTRDPTKIIQRRYQINETIANTSSVIQIQFTNKESFQQYIKVYQTLENDKNINILIPHIVKLDNVKNVLWMEDLGSLSLKTQKEEFSTYFPQCLDILRALQKWDDDGNNFRSDETIFKTITSEDLLQDFVNFNNYFLRKKQINPEILNIVKSIINSLSLESDYGIVHKDFQSTNLLIKDSQIYVIDFQDISYGPLLYDLASLLADCNIFSKINRDYLDIAYQTLYTNSKQQISKEKFLLLFYQTSLIRVFRSAKWRSVEYFGNYQHSEKEYLQDVIRELGNIISLIRDISQELVDISPEYTKLFQYIFDHVPTFLNTIILAGGKGSRMKSEIPKVLTLYRGQPFLEYVIQQAQAVRSDNILIIVGHQKDKVIQYLENRTDELRNIQYFEQKEQLGTGHAVYQVYPFIQKFYNGKILVLMGDAPLIPNQSIQNLLKYHHEKQHQCSILTKNTVDPNNTSGRIIRNPKDGKLLRIVEWNQIKTLEERNCQEVAVGVSLFDCQILVNYLPKFMNLNSAIENKNNNEKQKEVILTALFQLMIENRIEIGLYNCPNIPSVHSINKREELEQALQI